MSKPSLAVTGTGLHPGHLTAEAREAIAGADVVLCGLPPSFREAILALNPAAKHLGGYLPGRPRLESYEAMVERIMEAVRKGARTVACFYGNAAVYCLPGHEAVRRARAEGFPAKMLPGVSFLDCLFCDLGVDPSPGIQIFQATQLLTACPGGPPLCPTLPLVVVQPGTLGVVDDNFAASAPNMPILAEFLAAHYGPDHEVTCYEASFDPGGEPNIRRLPLSELGGFILPPTVTLYLPAREEAEVNHRMVARLLWGTVPQGPTSFENPPPVRSRGAGREGPRVTPR